MAENRYLRLYYDWLNNIEPLSDEEFRAVILAAASYSRDGTEPPPLGGLAGMAMSFVLSDMRRLQQKAESGRAGGLKRAENASASSTFKHTSSMLQHKDIDKDIDIDNNYDYDYDYDEDKDNARGRGSSSEVVEMFRELCPSLAQVQRMSPKLQETLREARTRFGMEELRQLFTKAEATPFLRGEGERGWKASLSWVLDHAEEIMAGSYDTHEKPQTSEAPENWADTWKDWNQKKSDHKENTA